MAHNARTRIKWNVGYVPQASEFDDLDQKTAEAVNGDDGGSWSPSSPIVIGGAGVRLQGNVAHEISGAGTKVKTTSGGRIELGDSDYPLLPVGHPGRSRTLLTRAEAGRGPEYEFKWGHDVGYLRSVALFAQLAIPLRVHHAATLSNVRVYFKVGAVHANVPATPPSVSVYRYKLSDGTIAFLDPAVATTGSWANGAAYTNGGATQYIDYPCTQNNVIDAAAYLYVCSWVDESGANAFTPPAGNVVIGAAGSFTTITDLGFA